MKPSSAILATILDEVRPLIGQGKVANYIPALAQVASDKLGIAVYTNQGEILLLVMRRRDFPSNPFPKR